MAKKLLCINIDRGHVFKLWYSTNVERKGVGNSKMVRLHCLHTADYGSFPGIIYSLGIIGYSAKDASSSTRCSSECSQHHRYYTWHCRICAVLYPHIFALNYPPSWLKIIRRHPNHLTTWKSPFTNRTTILEAKISIMYNWVGRNLNIHRLTSWLFSLFSFWVTPGDAWRLFPALCLGVAQGICRAEDWTEVSSMQVKYLKLCTMPLSYFFLTFIVDKIYIE